MRRYGIPFDHIEEKWTRSQFVAVLAAQRENDKPAKGRNAAEQAAMFSGR
jgi:hypothetical protein